MVRLVSAGQISAAVLHHHNLANPNNVMITLFENLSRRITLALRCHMPDLDRAVRGARQPRHELDALRV